jgi:hypothetical protein
MPTCSTPVKKPGKGRTPTKPVLSLSTLSAKIIVETSPIPWKPVEYGLGSNGPLKWEEKLLRVVEIRDDMPRNYIWLYAKKFCDKTIKYQISNAPEDTTLQEIRKVSTLRWAIVQNFKECKSDPGITNFEGRTWDGWHRHMLIAMMNNYFLLLLKKEFSLNVEDLSDKGKMIFNFLKSQNQNRAIKERSQIMSNKDKSQDKTYEK